LDRHAGRVWGGSRPLLPHSGASRGFGRRGRPDWGRAWSRSRGDAWPRSGARLFGL